MSKGGNSMIDRELYNHYRLHQEGTFTFGEYDAFRCQGAVYCIVPVESMEEEEIWEGKQLADFLLNSGFYSVAEIVPTRSQQLVVWNNGSPFILIRFPKSAPAMINDGKEAAILHQTGKRLPFSIYKKNRVGQWKEFWGARLDQLESWRGERMKENPKSGFEKDFIHTFPYFLGLTENAIQYIVDAELDNGNNGQLISTICYERFNKDQLRHYQGIRIPVKFVVDHPARDIAEWIRHQFWNEKDSNYREVVNFLNEYKRVEPLSPFFYTLVFGRLLFPVNYFECIEGFYSSESEADKQKYKSKFYEILARTTDYEQFLGGFAYNLGIEQIPKVAWLG